ncbi:hypothetical protein P154DRAFT_520560 [Amniculicola lignicola CBS 123094]|uniref:Mediator of RNA polymerase II transcription subunit 16 n=1 Tax=Amniculicola lignicola CBS 123094 TaxID=1392246 RepID=A0A6A5WLG0_9PLEO|nr:hypothetical protein P154DRAFT_520560 [Amniculicola lignicola CBS 123094]
MDDQAYNMDVDDLFGDSEQVSLPAIPVVQVKGLARRLDELSAGGCSQKIAWSKSGCVAYITNDGYGVNLRVFSRDSETGVWDLGKDTSLQIPHGSDDFPFANLSWSHLGNDLAVMNAAGHVMIFSCAMALDRMTFMRADLTQPESESDAVVGMHWLTILPYERKNHIAWSATGKGDRWSFQIGSHTFQDAHHPVEGRASLIYLKRHGELKLRFQQPDNSWQEVAALVRPMLSASEVFTHAAFASNNDDTLLLAAYDASCRMHIYRVEAKWNVPPPPKQGHSAKPFDKPELQVTEVDVVDDCYPTSPSIATNDLGTGPESRIRLPAQLTHLSFLPITPEKDSGTLPTIQAIFASPPNVISLDQTQSHMNPFSILVKWEVQHTQQNQLHSSLDKVTSKKKSVSSVPARDVFVLKRLPEIVLHSVVLSCFPLWYSMVLGFCYSDGTIEFRKRTTMDAITPDFNTETVTSLPQAGFSFSSLDPSVHVALSPNYCMAACMQQDGVIKLRSMEYAYGSLSSDEDDARHSAALAALVLQFASAANQYFCSDDVFAIIGDLSEKRKRDFIYLMFQGLAVNIDCGVEENNNNHLLLLGRSPFFVKTLSAAHLLGLQGSVNRSVASKIAWMILNIKYITQILTTIARMHVQIDKNPLRPEVVPQFIGICRWIMHFMVYMVDEIMTLGFELKDVQQEFFTRPTLEGKIHELNKPALLILLSSFPRMMMKLWAQPLNWVMKTAIGYTNNSPTPELRKVFAPIHQAFTECPFPWQLFEGLVAESHRVVRACYKRAGMNEQARNDVERELILGRVPEVLVPAARSIVVDFLFNEKRQGGALLDKIDPGRVMFFETTWLGFQNSKHARDWFETHVVDVCQKMVIRGTGGQSHPTGATTARAREKGDSIGANGGEEKKRKPQLRKCVRCGAYMEDVMQGMPGYQSHHVSWLMGVAKHCVCGNSWMLAEEKKGAK